MLLNGWLRLTGYTLRGRLWEVINIFTSSSILSCRTGVVVSLLWTFSPKLGEVADLLSSDLILGPVPPGELKTTPEGFLADLLGNPNTPSSSCSPSGSFLSSSCSPFSAFALLIDTSSIEHPPFLLTSELRNPVDFVLL